MTANNRQVGGNHYKQAGEEHWDRVVSRNLDYFQAQITKYVERCWEKMGIQDLEKAQHFIEKYIEVSRAAGRKGKMEPVMQIMDHGSDHKFTLEGIKENRVEYHCRLCGRGFYVTLDKSPHDTHLC